MNNSLALDKKAMELLEEVIEANPNARLELLEAACGGDRDLHQRAITLLDHYSESDSILENGAHISLLEGRSRVGEEVGPYRLIEALGSGSMGSVYLAERIDGRYQKQVAIKLIRFDFASPQLIARFQHERNILARLEHPHIARMMDAGSTPEDSPYYVMEYVEGTTIDQHCATHPLSTVDVIQLFCKICDGVHYAHRNLIIHRDIKPANILVDQSGQPKLLDFGIAKLLCEEEINLDLTLHGLHPMTPGYASPEQLQGNNLTTASDIYSLGVLLYRLLSGQSPYGKDTKTRKQLEQKIFEGRVVPLSRVMKIHLDKKIARSDLDNIIEKALSPEPERRYVSVQQFMEDLQCLVRGRPVIAHPDSVWYRSKRFLQRHKVSACLFVVVVLCGSLLIQRVVEKNNQIALERDKLQETQDFMLGMFELPDVGGSEGERIALRGVLDRGVEKAKNDLKNQPQIKSQLLTTMGVVYRKLGLYDTALPLLQEALQLRRKMFSDNSVEVADSLIEYGRLLSAQAKYQQAEEIHQQALNIYSSMLGRENLRVANAYDGLGSVYYKLGKYQQSIEYHDKSLAIKSTAFDDHHPKIASSYNNLGIGYWKLGEYDRAIEFHEKALAINMAAYGKDHINVGDNYNNLGIIYLEKDENRRAANYFEKSLSIQSNLLGEEHLKVANSYNNLGVIYIKTGEYSRALAYYEKSMAIKLKIVGSKHPSIAADYSNLGIIYRKIGDYPQAIEYHQKALELVLLTLGPGHPGAAFNYNRLGIIYFDQGNYEKAIAKHELAITIVRKALGESHPGLAFSYNRMGMAYVALHEYDKAVAYFEKAAPIALKAVGEKDLDLADAYHGLGMAYQGKGQYAEAHDIFSQAYDIRLSQLGADNLGTKSTKNNLISLEKRLSNL